jgi:hypothetical protein
MFPIKLVDRLVLKHCLQGASIHVRAQLSLKDCRANSDSMREIF